MLKNVKCEDIHTFPAMEIKFKDGTLKLEANYYIRRTGDKCFSTLVGQDNRAKMWILGDPLLVKFYTKYDMTPGAPSVTFYEAEG